ncbi:hypothetical protein M0804_001468 [Polistes exclamans]|nr:hypothetical protein M0804_001468 [Polistes exclamans]
MTLGVVEHGSENDWRKRRKDIKGVGLGKRVTEDKGKSTLMRHAKTKASISGEAIYELAAIRYKCIHVSRNPYPRLRRHEVLDWKEEGLQEWPKTVSVFFREKSHPLLSRGGRVEGTRGSIMWINYVGSS